MPRHSKAQKSTRPLKNGPVRPGSLLHQVLKIIAREIAKTLGKKSTSQKKADTNT